MCLNAHQMVATMPEAVQNLQNIMNEMIDEMYMVEEFI